jgi:PAS domain S-box-containing protein
MKDTNYSTENRFKELADLLPQTVFEIDGTGRLTYVNQFALEKFGYTLEEFEKGLSSSQMFVPEQRELALENVKVSVLGKRLGLEYTMLCKDGSTFPAIIHSSPVIRNGCPVGLRGIIVDISERKKIENTLQQNEQLLRSLVDNMLDATLILDWNGNVLFANNAAAKLVDLDAPADGKDLNIRDFLHPEHTQTAFEHLDRVNDNKGGFLWQYRIITRKSREKWVESLGTKIQLNGTSANIVNLRDITERKQEKENAFDLQMEQKKGDFEAEMAQKRVQWKKEQDEYEAGKKERDAQMKKERTREEEEYAYDLQLTRKKDSDEYEAKKAGLEKELTDRKASYERELAEREQAVALSEKELEQMRAKVESFPKELERALMETEKTITERFEFKSRHEKELMAKEIEGERKLSQQTIEALEKKIEEQGEQVRQLTQRANEATLQVQNIAIKAIEGASSSPRIIAERTKET